MRYIILIFFLRRTAEKVATKYFTAKLISAPRSRLRAKKYDYNKTHGKFTPCQSDMASIPAAMIFPEKYFCKYVTKLKYDGSV